MKYFIITLVVFIHILVIWGFVGCNDKRKNRNKKTTNIKQTEKNKKIVDKHPVKKKNELLKANKPLTAELQSKENFCKAGILIDWTNKKILWEKNANKSVPIASLTKMMTAFLLMQKIHNNPEISLNTQVKVSANVREIKTRYCYMRIGDNYSLDELLKCMMIRSANDAAMLIGQYLGDGKREQFVRQMNDEASCLGFSSFKFYNSNGLPLKNGKENYGSAYELALLAAKLLEYPEVVKWSSTAKSNIRIEKNKKIFDLNTTNPFVALKHKGVTGMKTGFTQKAKFCIALTCERQNRVLIAVVCGCETKATRYQLAKALLKWGYQ